MDSCRVRFDVSIVIAESARGRKRVRIRCGDREADVLANMRTVERFIEEIRRLGGSVSVDVSVISTYGNRIVTYTVEAPWSAIALSASRNPSVGMSWIIEALVNLCSRAHWGQLPSGLKI